MRTLVHEYAVGVLLALDMIVTAAVGATVVLRDRDAGVEDVAYSTPASNRTLVYSKVFGALGAGLPLFLLLIAHVGLGVLLGDLRPLGAIVGVGMAALTRANIAAFAVTQGLRAKTPSRAILRSMTGVLFFSIGCCTLLSPHVLVIQPMVTERWNDTLAVLFVVAFLVLVLLLSLMYRRLPRLFALRREDISSMPSPSPYGRYEPRLRV